MHHEWLGRTSPWRNLPQETRHLGPALGSSALASASPSGGQKETHKGTSRNRLMLRRPRATAEFYISAYQTLPSPGDSCKTAKASKGRAQTGQMLKGRVGSSFCKSYVFCHNIVRSRVCYQKEDLSGTKTTKQNTQIKKKKPNTLTKMINERQVPQSIR